MIVSILLRAAKGAATPAPESRALRPGGPGLDPTYHEMQRHRAPASSPSNQAGGMPIG